MGCVTSEVQRDGHNSKFDEHSIKEEISIAESILTIPERLQKRPSEYSRKINWKHYLSEQIEKTCINKLLEESESRYTEALSMQGLKQIHAPDKTPNSINSKILIEKGAENLHHYIVEAEITADKFSCYFLSFVQDKESMKRVDPRGEAFEMLACIKHPNGATYMLTYSRFSGVMKFNGKESFLVRAFKVQDSESIIEVCISADEHSGMPIKEGYDRLQIIKGIVKHSFDADTGKTRISSYMYMNPKSNAPQFVMVPILKVQLQNLFKALEEELRKRRQDNGQEDWQKLFMKKLAMV